MSTRARSSAYNAATYYQTAITLSWVTPWPWYLDAVCIGLMSAFLVHVFEWAERRGHV